MKRLASLALVGLALSAAPVVAQRAPGGPGVPGAPARAAGAAQGAQFLLARTGELELTDAQVVRLAAIARRAHERREATRESMRAAMPQRPAPGAAPQRPSAEQMQTMRQRMEQMRAQNHADLRDAIAVLTPDQQARAWEMMARRGAGGPGQMRGQRGPGGRAFGKPGEARGARGRGDRDGREGRPGRDERRRPAPPAPPAPNGAQPPAQP